MNKKLSLSILTIVLSIGFASHGSAQNGDCIQCTGCTVTGTYASAIGKNNTASGNNSFAGGYNSTASGSNSFAFGYDSKATQSTNTAIGNTALASGVGAYAIGSYVKASAQNSFAIGFGTTANYPLTNSTPNSIALGTNSKKPTMLITKASGNNYTGKVAIGPVTSPQAKLHIKSDSNENVGVFIETSNKATQTAYLSLFDSEHRLAVGPTGAMELSAGSGAMNLMGDHYCFGIKDEKKIRLYTQGGTGIYCNVKRYKNAEIRDEEGSSYAIDFSNEALCIRTAINQPQRGSEITNWKESFYLFTDGKIGIGSKTSFIENKEDEILTVQSPKKMDFNANNITLNGKIGINTANNVADYALAVNGGIISSKVYVKEVNQWPDHVFTDDYPLLSIAELEEYVNQHKHLPGIPSEREVTQQGYDLQEMQYLIMEKIEEMTRYIIQLQEEIDSIKTKSNCQVQFSYDASGNRTSRNIVIERIPSNDNKPADSRDLAYELFPNPTTGQFSIRLKEPQTDSKIHATLTTNAGKTLETREIHGTQSDFDLSGQSNGIYFLEIRTPEGTQTWKVIKQ
ncbi:MAG: T9SS type A sorting domain-containing protein [Bacteroidales bacterium]|nr:T9SS type A sorting domain-containing protein [Bacteroidales bacterium]